MNSTPDLLRATTPVAVSDGAYRLDVPDGWQQGRGAFGGLVLGGMLRAVLAEESAAAEAGEASRPLRTLSGDIASPVLSGAADIEVRAIRRGSGVATWSAELAQGGERLAGITAVLGRARPIEHRLTPTPPTRIEDWERLPLLPIRPPLGPVFARHFEYRSPGPFPFAGGSDASAEGWLRALHPLPSLGAPELVAYADAWWPSFYATETAPRPMATIAFTIQLFPTVSPLPPDQPLRYRARTVASKEGYCVEFRELWTAAGELVALNQQTFVMIR